MSNIIPVEQISVMAQAVAKSGLFGMKTPEQAMALMLVAQAEGYSPALAARDYHIIQGRPALKADAMLARFQMAGGRVEWVTYTDAEVKATFSHPQGGSITLAWTFEQAKKIGLTGKDNWRNYPRAMLRARVVSEGIRTVFPGCVVGVYTPEEVQDFTPAEKDITPAPAPTKEQAMEALNNIPEVVETEEPWEFHIPGKEHITLNSKQDWIDTLLNLVQKVADSKLDAAAKDDKISALKKANTKTFGRIGIMESSELFRRVSAMITPPMEEVELPKPQSPDKTS
ncbi:UNVERIFIED_CONTAM: hypothetical protein [Bacteriophage sp.]